MNPMTDPGDEIRRLLAARREVPLKQEYVDAFLSEFHSRQRTELLRTPAWKLAWERVGAAFAEFQVPRAAYAGAFGAFLVAVLMTLMLPGNHSSGGGDGGAPLASASVPAPSMRLAPDEVFVALPATFLPAQVGQLQRSSTVPPRYVLDARPVSYEPPFSF
jgi:hypothetical protein